jgi:hypothetical protein
MTVAIAVLSLGVLAVIVTLLTASGRQTPPPSEPGVSIPQISRRQLPDPELLLPNEHERLLSHRFRPFREPRGSWTQDDVDRFWKDPRSLTGDYLLQEGTREVQEILREVP